MTVQPDVPECRTPDRRERTCIQQLANGWIGIGDLCVVCVTQVMTALDTLGQNLTWHPSYTERAQRSTQ